MRSPIRPIELFLWGLCFTALFSFGWWRGAHPDFAWRSFYSSSDAVILMTPESSWIPDEFLQKLSKDAQVEIRVERVDDFADFEARLLIADAPSLVWIPLSWAKGLASQHLLYPAGERRALRNKVHPDFRSIAPELTYLPVLWNLEKSELRIEGLAIPMNGADRREGMRIATLWTNTEWAEEQLKDLPDSRSALSFSSSSDLPFERRADDLRNHPLSALKNWK